VRKGREVMNTFVTNSVDKDEQRQATRVQLKEGAGGEGSLPPRVSTLKYGEGGTTA
jgi:hypothetical protein